MALAVGAWSQGTAPAAPAPQAVLVKAAHLIDGRRTGVRDGVAVLVVGERIRAVGTAAEIAARRLPGRPRSTSAGRLCCRG